MSHSTLLLLPVFIQVALTFALLFRLGPARVAAVRRGEVKLKDIALGQNAWPDHITQLSRSFQNQFELPVLLYVLVGLCARHRQGRRVAGGGGMGCSWRAGSCTRWCM